MGQFHVHKTLDMLRLCHEAFSFETRSTQHFEIHEDAEMVLSLCALYLRHPDFSVGTSQHRRILRLKRRVEMFRNAKNRSA